MSSLLIKPSAAGASAELLSITPQRAGWNTISLHLVRLRPGMVHLHNAPEEELVLVPLGGRISVRTPQHVWESVGGRADVFSGMPYAVYLPLGTGDITIEALTDTCEVAICGARARRRFPPALIEPQAVEIEIRGGGNATRQINHILKPEFPADRILIVEVYTPAGNWSSYPPHKHDVHNPPEEVDLDEIYFFKFARPEAFAIQRVYTRDGSRDETITVRNNEAVLIPEGYHPVVAAHGYDCYYLNVLAGSARSMAASDDPDYAWIRESWLDKDPRLPLVRSEES